MKKIDQIIGAAGEVLRDKMEQTIASGGLTLERYARLLSMQFHLTRGVQRHFALIASHTSMRRKRALRDFLVDFAWEEEMHFEIARRDLAKLGRELLPCPLDVRLWWLYFDALVEEHPYIRLGGTCILENLGSASGGSVRTLLASAPFLNKDNTHFIEIHLHETIPHGEQILRVLGEAQLDAAEMADLEEGARTAALLYLRIADWVFELDPVAARIGWPTPPPA